MERRSSMVAERGALLLIALAVAALALPACKSNRDPGKGNVSLNNQKQLADAARMYAQDYEGAFPGWYRNADGRFAHNVWDEQISWYVLSPYVFRDMECHDPGIRSCTDARKQRVLSYGLNGLLIAPSPKFDGHAPFETVSARRPPVPMRLQHVTDPAGTILFARLATEQPMSGIYGRAPDPLPEYRLVSPPDPATITPGHAWQNSREGWIDISPREFVETAGAGSYEAGTWDASRGVARDMQGDGGAYAFVDGHVMFMRLSETVGLGRTVTPSKGAPYTVEPGDSAWRADNPHNMWNPVRARTGLAPGS